MLHKSSAWLAFSIVSTFYLFEFIARIEPSLAAEDIAAWFDLSHGGFGTLSSLFFWAYAPMQLAVGLLLDRYGLRRFVIPAIFIMSVGVALFTWTNDPILAAVGRLLTGFGASFGFVGGLYVVSHMFAPSRFALLSGAVNAFGMLGTAVGAIALTSIIEQTDWRTVFFATAIGGLVLFIISWLFLPDTNEKSETRQGLIEPLRICITDKYVWSIAVLGAFYYMPVNVFAGLWGKTELTADHGLPLIEAETAVSMIFWGAAVGSVAAGWLSDKYGHRKWFVASNALLAALAYSTAIYVDSSSYGFIMVMLFLGGLFGGAQMLTYAMAKEGHSKEVCGTIVAFVNMIGIGGALIFQPLIGTVVDMSGGSFEIAMLTIPVCLVVSALIASSIRVKKHADHIEASS